MIFIVSSRRIFVIEFKWRGRGGWFLGKLSMSEAFYWVYDWRWGESLASIRFRRTRVSDLGGKDQNGNLIR